MELIREQYGLVALRIGYSQGSRSEGERRDVTCSLHSPDADVDDWRVPADRIPLLATTVQTRSDAGVEEGLVDSVRRLDGQPRGRPAPGQSRGTVARRHRGAPAPGRRRLGTWPGCGRPAGAAPAGRAQHRADHVAAAPAGRRLRLDALGQGAVPR